MKFDSVKECLDDLHMRCDKRSPMEFQAKCREEKRLGHRQIACKACGRWKWPDERCNLFVATVSRTTKSTVSAPAEGK
jgi:hypothetical protein